MGTIPKSCKIVGKRRRIEWGKRIKLDGASVSGACYYDKCLIKVCTKQDPQQMRDTLLHEVIHSLDETLSLDLTEQQVHALAGGLYGLFKDNPPLTRWLLQ
ncbi:MAG: SprT family zinc-dependent metalloprotease [Ketobacter sp.]|nr:SprT family zinc-dependent metalloprotease [Ketobacter sp.]